MTESNRSLSTVMFVMTCVFGLVYFLLTSLIAFPVYAVKAGLLEATTIDQLKAFWELLTAIAPIILALIAYTLNFFDRGEIGSLFGLAMLALNLFKTTALTSISLVLRFLTDIAFPVLIMGYSVSDGAYRHHFNWLLVAVVLCVLRAFDMVMAMVTPGANILFEGLIGISCVLTHLFAFIGFVPNAGSQWDNRSAAVSRKAAAIKDQAASAVAKSAVSLQKPVSTSSRSSIEAYKKRKM